MAAVLQLLGQQMQGSWRQQQQPGAGGQAEMQPQLQRLAHIQDSQKEQQPWHTESLPAAKPLQQDVVQAKAQSHKSQGKLTALVTPQQPPQPSKLAKPPQKTPQQQPQQQAQNKRGLSPEPSDLSEPKLMSVSQLESAKELLHIQVHLSGFSIVNKTCMRQPAA